MIQKTIFYEELEEIFYYFRKYQMKILLGDCNAKWGGGKIFSNRQLGMRVYIRIVMKMVLLQSTLSHQKSAC